MMHSEDKESRRVVARFKSLMLERGVPLCKTVMYGSRARKDAEPDSDLDVLAIVERLDAGMRKAISRCAWEAGFDTGIVIQSVVMTRDQVENGPERSSLLMLAVEEEGVLV